MLRRVSNGVAFQGLRAVGAYCTAMEAGGGNPLPMLGRQHARGGLIQCRSLFRPTIWR